MKNPQIEFKDFASEAKARVFPLTSVSLVASGITVHFLKSIPERGMVDHYTLTLQPKAGFGTWRKLSPLFDCQGSGSVDNIVIDEETDRYVVLKGIWVESGMRTQMAVCVTKSGASAA